MRHETDPSVRGQGTQTRRPSGRTDVHAPVNFVPEDYAYQFCYSREAFADEFGVTIPNPAYDKACSLVTGGQVYRCHHCGASIMYGAVMLHKPTGEYIVCGETCLNNRFSVSKADFDYNRKHSAALRLQMRIKTAMLAWLDTQPEDVREAFDRSLVPVCYTHEDIRRKAWELYGVPSAKQVGLVLRLVREAQERAEAEADRKAKEAEYPLIAAPSGVCAVTGRVLAVKSQESDYGCTLKMLLDVQCEDGHWKAWLTFPSGLDASKGDTVRLTADFTPSDSDKTFAYGKRPRKAERVEVQA